MGLSQGRSTLAAMFLGLRTVIYPVVDLAASRQWYAELLGYPPYFDQPFYVGFEVGGYELGLHPETVAERPEAYWGVADVDVALAALVAAGAPVLHPVSEVGDGIRIAAVQEPGGAFLGIIENPHFRVVSAAPPGDGPRR